MFTCTGPTPSSSSSFSAISNAPPAGSRSKILPQQDLDLLRAPVMQNAPERIQVGLRQIAARRNRLPPHRCRSAPRTPPHTRAPLRTTFGKSNTVAAQSPDTRSHAAIARCPVAPPKSTSRLKAAQVERAHHRRRGQHSESVHAAQEIAHRLVGVKEAAEERPIEAERLLPAWAAFPNRIGQIAPHRVQRFIRVPHIRRPANARCRSRDTRRPSPYSRTTRPSSAAARARRTHPAAARSRPRPHPPACAISAAVAGPLVQAVEDAHPERREHGLRAAKSFDQVEYRRRIRQVHGVRKWS